MKKILTIFLAVIMALSFGGCSKNNGNDTTVDKPIEKTEHYLVKGASTDYKVVIPEDATEWEEFAAEELVYFFEASTGLKLSVISDKGITFNENDSYLSIGRTSIYEQSGVSATYDELKRDGYKVIRKGKTVIMVGGGDYGHIYAVYGFLRKNFGYRAYAPDELCIEKFTELNLLDFNLTDIPDFENRTGGYYVTTNDRVFATRLRTFAGYGTRLFQQNNIWGSWAHTYFGYLNPDVYYAEHPDWYDAGKQQLCLSNMEMRDAMTEKIKEKILEYTDAELFMLGQSDNNAFCTCANCKAITDVIGPSGLMMQFTNDIAERIENWQKEACPNRRIEIGTFAYLKTQAAPVVEENGQFKPINDSVVARENVFVLLAPISADWCSPIYDEEHNVNSLNMFKGWSVCSERLSVWAYCNNFGMSLEYFDNIGTTAANYKFYRDYGATYMYNESSLNGKQAFAFQTMMAYVHSELMWNCEQNVDELISDFIKHYYKEAAEPMQKYFDLIRTFVTTRKIEMGKEDGKYYGTGIWAASDTNTLLNKDFWRKNVLDQMLEYFDEAYELIDEAGYKGDEREKMRLRLMTESLTPRMYMLECYATEINDAEYLKMITDFENDAAEVGVSSVFSGQSMAETMNNWRNNVK